MITLNNQQPIIADTISGVDYQELMYFKNINEQSIPLKYQSIALRLKSLLGNCSIYRYDIKVQELKQGELPCLPGWHLDNGPYRPTRYALVTFGCSRTEFNTNPLEVLEEKNMKVMCHRLNQLNLQPTLKLKDGQVIVYNNNCIHRGAPADYNGKRLLIRASGTNNYI